MNMFFINHKSITSVLLLLLTILTGQISSYADITPVSERTAEVRDAIIAAAGVETADEVQETHLASITELNLRGKGITVLKTGDFSGLTALTNLNLYGNKLKSLPAGIFDGLAALTTLRLGSNITDPMLIPVSLEKVGEDQFKAVVPTGAPFAITVPVSVTNGTVTGGTSDLTVSIGSTESSALTVTRVTGTTAAVTANIGTLPNIPSLNHYGYALSKSTTLPLIVIRSTVNVAPEFVDGDSTTRSIAENVETGKNIGEAVAATDDLDVFDDTLTYSLNGTDAASFDIDSTSGQLLTKASLNYEDTSTYSVSIIVSDGSLTDTINVTINVTDVNEAPAFADETATRAVDEKTASGQNIGTPVSATDEDEDTLTYSLGGTATSTFDIDSETGQLKTKAALYYEIQFSYVVSIIVSDGSLTDTITVTININDVDEVVSSNAPVFTEGGSTTRSVAENTASGENIGDAISATDADGDTLRYFLSGTDAASFDIDSETGQLQTKAALDYETKSTYTVSITVSDESRTDKINVTINITDVDEAVSNNAPVFTEGASATRSIAENTASGENIGDAISATDADGDTLTYRLSGTDADSFDIDSGTGQLQTKAALDYETKSSYTVSITVSDGNGGSASISVTINITDVNEAPVFATATATRSVAENTASGENIGDAISATDADGDTLTYRLSGTNAASFDIDSGTGQLQTKTSLDYETKTSYTVTITVSDEDLTDTISVTINVTDVNEAPVFAVETATYSVAENTAAGQNIGIAISATDVDASGETEGDSLTYSLDGTDGAAFDIVRGTGQLKTKSTLDYEIKSVYIVTITASDGDLTDTITVIINITDVDEVVSSSAPVFTDGASATRAIAENTVASTNIGTPIIAIDADGDTLGYGLSGADAAAFSIDRTTGQLKTESALDYEIKSVYIVTITASDGSLTDTITVTINITDVDEVDSSNAPVFTEGASTTRTVAENTVALTNIGTPIIATDVDGDTLGYGLSGADAAAFVIDRGTGQLKTWTALDYETKSTYTVTVIVSDGSLTDTIGVTINVTDVNDAPVFAVGTATYSVAENTASGENIGDAISATDDDGDTLTYSLGGTDAGTFDIVSGTGQLQTKAALDYETKTSYTVTITVSDGDLTDTISVTINITDVEEVVSSNAPVFTEGASATRSIAENTASGENIGDAISATDADGDTLTYRLSGTDAASFDLVSTSGQLKTKAALDYETKTSYTVTITVSDGSLTDTISVTINITDVDENTAPVFTDGASVTRSVAENTASGENIGDAISATDADDDTLTYRLSGTDADSFDIVSGTGQLQTKAALDYETKSSYTVSITVSDGNGGSASISVTINITDVDESNTAPVFATETATRSVAENTAAGQNIGGAISATDADGDTLTYRLTGTDADSFDIVSGTGQLQTKAALDYETKTSYTVSITVSDGNGGSASISVTINITDVDESNTAPVFATATATRSVAENTAAGQNIGDAISATDADGDTLTYRLSGTDADSFDIVSTSGQLQTKAALDYETKTSYTVTITASDGSLTDTISVTINITDVDESISNTAPVFATETATRSVAENTAAGQNIGDAISATDADGDTLTYRLSGTDADSFDIISTSGQLQTKAALDYETKTSYTVTITVSDGSLTDTISVTINITDVDESISNTAPVFATATATRSVAENTAAGENIGGAISATDADGDTLTYRLSGTDADSFDIVSGTGQLKTKAALNYEAKSTYTVSITVSDGNGGSASITVTINITDVDEQNTAPVFATATATRSVAEYTAAGQNIGTAISATDADGDTLTYRLSGTDAASFDIVSTTGQLQTKAALNYKAKTSYTVSITVSDGNGGSDSIAVTINITTVPVFTDGASVTRSVAENTAAGENIGDAISATDADGDTLTYRLSGTDADSFDIDSGTGQLQTKVALDYETKTSYTVSITVSDGNSGSDSITVTINITDVNDAPVFATETATRSVAENTAAGENIGDAISATDADGDTLTYSLTGTDADSFDIDSGTGQLTTKAALNYETKSSYTVSITASDADGGSASITVTINITDVEESNVAPVFTEGASALRAIAENVADGNNIGAAVSATDADGDTLTYSLTGKDPDSFDIVSTTGQLQTKVALNYEARSTYTVTVNVSDGNGGSASITVTINIADVAEVNNAPVFTDGASATRTVLENIVAGENVGDAISATDADGDALTYRLSGTDAASFNLDTTTGQLQSLIDFDYYTQSTYSLTITVIDADDGSAIDVTINVINICEVSDVLSAGQICTYPGTEAKFEVWSTGQLQFHPETWPHHQPYFLSLLSIEENNLEITGDDNTYTFRVTKGIGGDWIITNIGPNTANNHPRFTEGGSTTREVPEVVPSGYPFGDAVTASDTDGDTLTYSLIGGDTGSFSIDSTSGKLSTNTTLDYDTKSSYSLTVSASDGNGAIDTINVTIQITNICELNEILSVGDSCIYPGTDATFRVESNSGVFTTNVEDIIVGSRIVINTNDYTFKAQKLIDGTWEIQNVETYNYALNEHNPEFSEGASTTRNVRENTLSNTNIGNPVSATDADGDTLTYALSGTDAASFDIDSSTGQLKTKSALDYETKQSYSVTITVNDSHANSDTIAVTINVTDTNELGFLVGRSGTRSVDENTDADVNIGDPFTAKNYEDDTATLTYSLEGRDRSSFDIDSSTGQLKTMSALDFETKSSYSVRIVATQVNVGNTSINVTINVNDIFESTPISQRSWGVRRLILWHAGTGTAARITDADLVSITELNLGSAGSLKSGDFSGMTNLKKLLFQNNSLTTLPEDIFEGVSTLEFIDASGGSITSLPEDVFDGLSKLKELDFARNNISSLPEDIFDGLSSLEKLDLRRNDISALPEDVFDGLNKLVVLDLGNNDISALPEDVFDGLSKLKELVLDLNDIAALHADVFDGLNKLEVLNLEYNEIPSLPNGVFQGLVKLTTLKLQGNEGSIFSIPVTLYKSTRISNFGKYYGAYIHKGAPFDLTINTEYTNGWTYSGVATININGGTSNGDREIEVFREAGTTAAVTVDIGELPSIPDTHNGYTLVKAADLPLTLLEAVSQAPTASEPIPDKTDFHANYPNPFNPETWIPYQLSEAADVTMTVYNMRGVVIRKLALGHQKAGFYTSRQRAAHWDGRNGIGERVATGVYFVTFKAGEFSATRKMLIRK